MMPFHTISSIGLLDVYKRQVISFALTHFTRNIYIRQEMHFYLKNTIAGAGFAPATLHIKAESSLLVSSCLGIRSGRKQISYHIKHTGIRCV